jgi:hypothetical protein
MAKNKINSGDMQTEYATKQDVQKIVNGAVEGLAQTIAKGFEGMATKDELKSLRSEMATKVDIKGMATKADIKNMATKADIRRVEKDVKELQKDMKDVKSDVAVNRINIEAIQDDVKDIKRDLNKKASKASVERLEERFMAA